MSKIKLLVLDENNEFHSPLEQYTRTVPAIKFLGVRTNVKATIECNETESPDLVLYASALIKSSGEEPLGELRTKWPNARFYRLTVFDDSGYDKYDYVKGFDGSVPRSQIEDHLNAIIQTFRFTEA